jgi:SprT protein
MEKEYWQVYTENQILEEIGKIMDKANSIFPDHPIDKNDITVFFNLTGVCAGKANHRKNQLFYNLILAEENLKIFLTDTVPHEIAHLYQFKINPNSKAHNNLFYNVMSRMGYRGTRTHQYNTATIKKMKYGVVYNYSCNCTTHKVSPKIHNKILNGQSRYCQKCKAKIKFIGEER